MSNLFPTATTLAVLVFSSCAAAGPQRSRAEQALQGWKTNTGKRSIDLAELLSGGPPKDGIPAIDNPRFEPLDKARTWLKAKEPVVVVESGGDERAYPLQILMWHEIVNDRLGDRPVAVTFCPLCYSAIVFESVVEGRELTFGVSGMLRHSDLVMYDRETESLWQQMTGEAIVGDLTGARLSILASQIISFEQFSQAYPGGLVLSRDTGHKRDYGRNPYAGYDDATATPFLFRGHRDARLRPMEKVIAVSLSGVDRAYPHSVSSVLGAINDEIGGQPVAVFHGKGALSALDRGEMASSKEAGSTGVFDPRVDGRVLTFEYTDGRFVDRETGSRWDITGRAEQGALKGRRLTPTPHGDFFAFAWLVFKPDSEVYRR